MTSLGFYTPALSSFYSIAIFLSLDSLFPGKKTNPEINKSPNSPAKKKKGIGKPPIWISPVPITGPMISPNDKAISTFATYWLTLSGKSVLNIAKDVV